MVPLNSYLLSRGRYYLGIWLGDFTISRTWLSHSAACLSMQFNYNEIFWLRHLTCTWMSHPTTPHRKRCKTYNYTVWALSFSLATTQEVEVSFFSWWYLDVSVPIVSSATLCIQITVPKRVGCPIRKSPGHSFFISLPKLIADWHVLHRCLMPRHPSNTLTCLKYKNPFLQRLNNQDKNIKVCFLKWNERYFVHSTRWWLN